MERQWRHLDFFQYEAYIHAKIPRTNCREHGIKTVNVPWTRKDSGFTKLFEYHALDFCGKIPISSVSLFLHTGQDSVWRIRVSHVLLNVRQTSDIMYQIIPPEILRMRWR